MSVVVKVDSVTQASVMSWKVKRIISRRASSFEIILLDPDGLLYNTINYFDDVEIIVDSTPIFKGRIELRNKKINKITSRGRDYWQIFIDRTILGSYSAQTASAILTDIIGDITEITGTAIQSTTITYNRNYRNVPISRIITDFCELENFQAYVDTDLDFHFETQGYIDSGVYFNWSTGAGGILSYDFPELGKKVKNNIFVYGRMGTPTEDAIIVQLRDTESIALYGEKTLTVQDNSILTEADADKRAEFEIKKWANPIQTGKISLLGNEDLNAGDLVYVTIPALGFDETAFLIVEIEQKYPPFQTFLTLAEYRTDMTDILDEYLKKLEKHDAAFSDLDGTIKRWEYFTESTNISPAYEILREYTTGLMVLGTGQLGQDILGEGTEEVIDSGNMVLTNVGKNIIRNWLAGDGPTEPLGIAVGTGTTPALATDTALETETSREAFESGYPLKPANYEVIFQREIDTSEENGNTLTEIGLFDNATSGGNLICRQVFTGIPKTVDFSLKMNIDLTVS